MGQNVPGTKFPTMKGEVMLKEFFKKSEEGNDKKKQIENIIVFIIILIITVLIINSMWNNSSSKGSKDKKDENSKVLAQTTTTNVTEQKDLETELEDILESIRINNSNLEIMFSCCLDTKLKSDEIESK